METIVVYALYLWVAVSIVALVTQLVRRARYQRARTQQQETPAPGGLQVAPAGSVELDLTTQDATVKRPSAVGSERRVVPAPEPAIVGGRQAPPPPAPRSASTPPPRQMVRSLPEVLEGARFPHNLLPARDRSLPASDQRLSLLTNSATPGEVGGSVADELERLGFVVAASTDDQATATRGNDIVGLRIITDAAAAQTGAIKRFPDVDATTVALDLWLEN